MERGRAAKGRRLTMDAGADEFPTLGDEFPGINCGNAALFED